MEPKNEIAIPERSSSELRVYQKRRRRGHHRDDDSVPEFEGFLEEVSMLFKFRSDAEEKFKKNPHLAYNKTKALPLGWTEIEAAFGHDSPPENLLTRIARECIGEVESLVRDLRKVLVREREKVSLGMVQQVDSHCLRWLTRQPGRDAVEKAGANQRILAIVRRENFNTLENRVFKDFLERTNESSRHYLKLHREKFLEHGTIKAVQRLYKLSEEGLEMLVMETIRELNELPVPNYVLRQERRYSKIWKNYCALVREAEVAERLWIRKNELTEFIAKLKSEIPKQLNPLAKFHCPLWFNVVDGKQEFIEKPFYRNSLREKPKEENWKPDKDSDDLRIIDLTGRLPKRDLLIYGRHENAKPYLQNYEKPSIEDIGENGAKFYFLNDILKDSTKPFDGKILRDYFEQLHAIVGGKHWIILVPDDWNAMRQEEILRAAPLARKNVTLLWRSVAAVLGEQEKLKHAKEGEDVIVVDYQQNGKTNMSKLCLLERDENGFLIPQRKSYERNKEERYWIRQHSVQNANEAREEFSVWGLPKRIPESARFHSEKAHNVFVGNFDVGQKGFFHSLRSDKRISIFEEEESLVECGARIFWEKRKVGKIAYYDELEAFSLVIQTRDERVVAKNLVKANEKFTGGESAVETNDDVSVRAGEEKILFFLCLGDATPNAPLKTLEVELPEIPESDEKLHIESRMTPGQGMAVATVTASFLKTPIVLDFLQMALTDKTIASIERDMERSFPPDSPDVVADGDLWREVFDSVSAYLNGKYFPIGGWFAKAAYVYPQREPLPYGLSPLERLRRKNVFGNDENRRLPKIRLRYWESGETDKNFDFEALFEKLAEDYKNRLYRDDVTRLIAWTYQRDNPVFSEIKREILERYQWSRNIKNAEYTLLANLTSTGEEWKICMETIKYQIAHRGSVQWVFRLLFNLLQFNPELLKETRLYEDGKCWEFVQYFPYWLEQYSDTVTQGFILKALLYFLRCRRFDNKTFLTKEKDRGHYACIVKMLLEFEPTTDSIENLRDLILKYLDGKGTIEGLPSD